jgi:hypothetical protein
METNNLNLNKRFNKNNLEEFSFYLKKLSREIGFKVSSRGWAYLLETRRLINKDEFDKVTNLINKCRKEGYLPIDFVAEEDARAFHGIETPTNGSVIDDFGAWLESAKNAAEYYTPDWWDGEKYYIQMVVEKVDLVTLFEPVCNKYHIPIANSRGWGSMLQRAEYAKRFLKAENIGLKCVLLYCGDHDPDGLRISEFIRNNLEDLKYIKWSNYTDGYDPCDLIIERFGLNYDFIEENNLTWIDNLITGSKMNLADPSHKNYHMSYVQEYLKTIGERKCEANAIVTMPNEARELVENSIIKYLGDNALNRFEAKRQAVRNELQDFFNETGLEESINNALNIINNRNK